MKYLNKYKGQLIAIAILYLLICVMIVGNFMVTGEKIQNVTNLSDNLHLRSELFYEQLLNPFGVMWVLITTEGLFIKFLKTCGVLLLTFIGMILWMFYKNGKIRDFEGLEHGSSDWAKNGEEFKKQPDGSEILNRTHGFVLSRKHFLGTDLRKVRVNKNILVFGGSGTGKSACYVKPNILQKLGSYVITDPKGELYRDTSKYLEAAGWKIKVLNLVDTEYSNRYNPLMHIHDYADVDIIAHTIVTGGTGEGKSQDPFWDNTAKMLLKACIYYVISVLPEEERNLSSCLNIVRAGGSDESVFDKLFVNELKPDHPGRKEYEGIRVGADKTKQSIAISLVSKLSHFDSPNMQRLTTTNDIDFEALADEKTALYVISPDSHTTYNYILTIFYGQLLQRLYAKADKNGGALNESVYLLLDEFANIGKIPDFNQKLSTSRSRGISISIIVQSLDQLVDLYKDLYENIISNCDTQIFLGSQSIKTCEYISKSLGQKTLTYGSKSKSRDKANRHTQGVTESEQRQGRDLMTIDELKRMPMDDEIIVVRGIRPIYTEKAWFFKYHPERDTLSKYVIKDQSEMIKTPRLEIKTMDVQGHIDARIAKAKEITRTSTMTETKPNVIKEKNIDEEKKEKITKTETIINTKSETIDIQKELERKFDELFGTANISPLDDE